MDNCLCLVFLLCCLSPTFGQIQNENQNQIQNQNQNPNQNQNQFPMNNGTMNFGQNNGTANNTTTTNRQNLNVGNPDQGNITRPCLPYDTPCIRRFFAEHSHCKKVYGPVPEPFYRKREILYVPRVNGTGTLYDVELTGLNGRIEEFYVNQDTDKLVIAIDFRGLTLVSNRTFIRIHRRAKEPVVVKTSIAVTYQSVLITAIIPQIHNLRLDKSVVFAYLNDPVPNYMLGPEITTSTDPTVQATLAAFLQNPRANVGELFLTDAPFYPATFIQCNICDFGLHIL